MTTLRPIPGQPEYAATPDGCIWSLKGGLPRKLKSFVRGRRGHLGVNLTHDGKYKLHSVHRLIAITFIGQPPTPAHFVMHCDDDPSNNAANNLSYGLPRDNSAQMVRLGRQARGDRHGAAKLTRTNVVAIREALSNGVMGRDLAAAYGVSTSTISDIKKHAIWRD